MTSPMPCGPGDPASTAAARERMRLARRWAHQLSETACIPLTYAELEERLARLVDGLCETLVQEPPTVHSEVATHLVDLKCTDPASLRVTIKVLGSGLLSLAGSQRSEQVVGLLSFLAADYAERMRISALDQQEILRQSILKAMLNAQLGLQASEARFNQLERASSSGMAITDPQGRFLRVNNALCTILGHTSAELIKSTLFDLVHPDDQRPLRADYQDLLRGKAGRVHEWRRLVRKDTEIAWVSVRLSLLESPSGQQHIMMVVEDSTELHLLQGQLNRQLLHDELTWLPNRQFFSTWLEKTLRTADPATGVTLYHLDLDAFAMISCGLGRRAGDLLLKTVAQRLKDVVAKENAMVARFGGDEFAILVENSATTPDVPAMVQLISDRLAEPVDLDGHIVAGSVTIGVVDRPAHHISPADLLDSADLTLRRAKSRGWRQWELFDAARGAGRRAMLGLAVAMPRAWQNGEIQVLYQPLVRLSDERMTGVEAVLDWDHPLLSHLPHDECMRLADRTGLAVPLGHWLLRSACERVAAWQQAYDRDVLVRVSLTPSQTADPDLAGTIRMIIRETGLRTDSIRLGLPLEALSDEHSRAVDNVKLLVQSAIHVELDDAGMGSACLLRLAELPVQSVKIARAVAKWAPKRPEEDLWAPRALKNLLAILHDAGITVTIGGVETTAQADWWREAGADSACGAFFAHPQPPEDIVTLFMTGA